MTTETTTTTVSEADALALLSKLNAWAQELSAPERACLEALLLRASAADEADVAGFMMKAQPYEPALRPVPTPGSSSSAGTPLDIGSINVLPYITVRDLANAGGYLLSSAFERP